MQTPPPTSADVGWLREQWDGPFLAANGQTGVGNVFDVLRGGIDSALMGLGRASIHDLVPDDVIIPAGFTRSTD